MRIDRYPTRLGNEETFVRRDDKVVWGVVTELTPFEWRIYDRNGYLHIRNFFDRDLIRRARDMAMSVVNLPADGVFASQEPNSQETRSILGVHDIALPRVVVQLAGA